MIGISGNDFLYNSMGWSAEKLAILFMAGYERPSYDPSVNHYQQRQANATAWLQFMQGVVPPSPVDPAPVGNVNLRTSQYGNYYGTYYCFTNSLNDEQKKVNIDYIVKYLTQEGWSLNSIAVLVGAMDLISTLNPGYWENNSNEGDYGLLGWRKWEMDDWIFDGGTWVYDSIDPSVIDNSLGRICWYRQYDLAWNDIGMTLQQFSESNDSIDNLASSWINNYVYNSLSLSQLISSIYKWYNYIFGITGSWKWLYGTGTKIRLTIG